MDVLSKLYVIHIVVFPGEIYTSTVRVLYDERYTKIKWHYWRKQYTGRVKYVRLFGTVVTGQACLCGSSDEE